MNGNEINGAVLEEAQEIAGPEYKQPSRDEIALKLSQHATKQDWEGFITWIDEQLNAANAAGYTEGYEDGANGD